MAAQAGCWTRTAASAALLLMAQCFTPSKVDAQTAPRPSVPSSSLPAPLPSGLQRSAAADLPPLPGETGNSPPSLLSPPNLAPPPPGMNFSGAVTDRLRSTVPFSSLFVPRSLNEERGENGVLSRPRPGSIFNPGASGPGISQTGDETFLDGALDPKTGWPFVLLNHFRPRPERMEGLWMVETRDCPQKLGTDPWPEMKIRQFDTEGRLVDRPLEGLMAQASTRPVLIVIQGNLTTQDMALGGLLWSHAWLQYNRSLPADAVVISFDWPSQRVNRFDLADVDEKGRRATVAGFHLARFLQSFPAGSRVSLVGQSYGCRVIASALHLLGGGCVDTGHGSPSVKLNTPGSAANLKATLIAGAIDHHWLNPGERFDRTLIACQGLLNLYNRRDEALLGYPLLRRSNHRQAIGRIGLTNRDLDRLGKLAERYEEHDVHEILGMEHTLLDAVANPRIGRWMAPYLWAPDPGPAPPSEPVTQATPFAAPRAILSRAFKR